MRTWIVTPAFCKAAMLDDCLAHIWATPPKDVHAHVVLDNHYPGEERATVRAIAERHGCVYFDSGGDFGLYRSVNQMMRRFKVGMEDFFCGCDPDDRPSPGWVETFRDVMLADSSFAVVAAIFPFYNCPETERAPDKRTPFEHVITGLAETTVAGHRVLIHPTIGMWKTSAVNLRFVMDMGGHPVNANHPLYGGHESIMYEAWKSKGMRLGYVPSITTEHVPTDYAPSRFDPSYREWKEAHLKGFQGTYAEWRVVSA